MMMMVMVVANEVAALKYEVLICDDGNDEGADSTEKMFSLLYGCYDSFQLMTFPYLIKILPAIANLEARVHESSRSSEGNVTLVLCI